MTNNSTKDIDYTRFINSQSSARIPALLREITKRQYASKKEIISLGEGMPNESTFPLKSLSVELTDGSKFTLEGQEIGSALQYIPTKGYPPLVDNFREFMYQIHKPPKWSDTDIIITHGGQDGLSKVLEMVLEDGDTVLIQSPVYPGTDAVLKPIKLNVIELSHDEQGIILEHLIQSLENAKKLADAGDKKKMPKLIYLNPTASNPSGVTTSNERRKEIYNICCKYDLLIFEDDPYYFIHFLDEQPISFLSMDVEGRVIRLDSFSKVMGPGFRLGWLTGPNQLFNNIELHMQCSTCHPSTICQFIVKHIFESWGISGILSHFESITTFYKKRLDFTLASMEKHLKGLCEWTVPTGGIFVWLKVLDVPDVYEMLMVRGFEKQVIIVPGHAFFTDSKKNCRYIRANYARASLDKIDKAMEILAELIKEEKVLVHEANLKNSVRQK